MRVALGSSPNATRRSSCPMRRFALSWPRQHAPGPASLTISNARIRCTWCPSFGDFPARARRNSRDASPQSPCAGCDVAFPCHSPPLASADRRFAERCAPALGQRLTRRALPLQWRREERRIRAGRSGWSARDELDSEDQRHANWGLKIFSRGNARPLSPRVQRRWRPRAAYLFATSRCACACDGGAWRWREPGPACSCGRGPALAQSRGRANWNHSSCEFPGRLDAAQSSRRTRCLRWDDCRRRPARQRRSPPALRWRPRLLRRGGWISANRTTSPSHAPYFQFPYFYRLCHPNASNIGQFLRQPEASAGPLRTVIGCGWEPRSRSPAAVLARK
jgi:hypothetical protein